MFFNGSSVFFFHIEYFGLMLPKSLLSDFICAEQIYWHLDGSVGVFSMTHWYVTVQFKGNWHQFLRVSFLMIHTSSLSLTGIFDIKYHVF